MKIDWAALGMVALTSVVATVLFVPLLAGGVRLVAANLAPAGATVRSAPSGSARVIGYVLLALAGLLVLLGIYLILPFSR